MVGIREELKASLTGETLEVGDQDYVTSDVSRGSKSGNSEWRRLRNSIA